LPAAQHQPRLGGNPLGYHDHFVERNAELRRLLAGLRVRMAVDRDVRIDANSDARRCFDIVRDGRQGRQLAGGLDIDEADAGPNRLFDLRRRFSHSREDDAVRVEPGDPRAPQLTYGTMSAPAPSCFKTRSTPRLPLALTE